VLNTKLAAEKLKCSAYTQSGLNEISRGAAAAAAAVADLRGGLSFHKKENLHGQ
jgi:hypothetical protein